jgi:hypothetical protein
MMLVRTVNPNKRRLGEKNEEHFMDIGDGVLAHDGSMRANFTVGYPGTGEN